MSYGRDTVASCTMDMVLQASRIIPDLIRHLSVWHNANRRDPGTRGRMTCTYKFQKSCKASRSCSYNASRMDAPPP